MSLPSSVPSAPISDMYSHRAISGKLSQDSASSDSSSSCDRAERITHLIKMLSILAPGVARPNFVPRS
jgi:hypothetical protein